MTEEYNGIYGDVDEDSLMGDVGDSHDNNDEFGGFEGNFDPPPCQTVVTTSTETVTTSPETSGEANVPTNKPKRAKRVGRKAIVQPMSKRKKILRAIVRKAGLKELPTLEELMRGKTGTRVKIKDIGLFIDEPGEEVLRGLFDECPIKNVVNLSASILLSRVKLVGTQVLNAMRMFQPIQVARITDIEDESLQCTSGRHRLAFLAMAYGPESEIPVYIEEMTLNEARDAVVVANQARPTKALEKAEHAVLRSVSGNADAEQEEIYRSMSRTKSSIVQYCTYSVIYKRYPSPVSFKVSDSSGRIGGIMTTVNNLGWFWKTALEWHNEMPRKEFDKCLKDMVLFINSLVQEMQKVDGFNPAWHLSNMALQAVGKLYRAHIDAIGKPPETSVVAASLVGLGETGRQNYEKTYQQLRKALR